MLASNFSRNSGVASYIDAARNQIVARLQSMGYSPQIVQFSTSQGDNIEVEIPGASTPDEWVVIGAHYDSLNGSGSSSAAPGADDNASGSAAVLEIARLLGTLPLRRTVRFGFWNAEEFGLWGSDAYATAARSVNANIVAYLNTDMNAYRAAGDPLDLDFVLNNSTKRELRSGIEGHGTVREIDLRDPARRQHLILVKPALRHVSGRARRCRHLGQCRPCQQQDGK